MSTQSSKRPRQQDDDVDYVDSVHTQRIKTLNEGSDEEIERKVKALCRYVLACEYKKINIRRENINKIITPDNKRIFNTLLEQANQRLRTIFGYELQEAILKDKNVDEQHQYDTQTQAESSTQRRATGGGTSGVYILRNIMKEHFILPDIVKRSTEDYINTGVLYVILALLFIHEREMDSNDLFEHLDRLKVTRYGQEPLPDRDQLMDTFVKNQYIRKTKLDEQDGEEIQYRFQWGPRAYTEIPAQNMVEFISSVSAFDMVYTCFIILYSFITLKDKKRQSLYVIYTKQQVMNLGNKDATDLLPVPYLVLFVVLFLHYRHPSCLILHKHHHY